jgi:hypothetical protein
LALTERCEHIHSLTSLKTPIQGPGLGNSDRHFGVSSIVSIHERCPDEQVSLSDRSDRDCARDRLGVIKETGAHRGGDIGQYDFEVGGFKNFTHSNISYRD